MPDLSADANLFANARLILIGIGGSVILAAIKITAGVYGNSQALIADGIESLTDVISSLAVLTGVALAQRPPDSRHPWGHGKKETFAALFVGLALMAAVALIAYQSIQDILRPHDAPAWYTLPVLVLVVIVKIVLARALTRRGRETGSPALNADAWHHLSDAITSGAAFIGIAIALLGGPGWESADDWAALLACSIIAGNSFSITQKAFEELAETAIDPPTLQRLHQTAATIPGVLALEKLRARRSGSGILMDVHVQVDPNLTVAQGHHIAGKVKYALLRSPEGISDVLVHLEPYEPNSPKKPSQANGPSKGRSKAARKRRP